MHRGGRGDARASCASPLGTPLAGHSLARADVFYCSLDVLHGGVRYYYFFFIAIFGH
jgi:hypothetical protein